MTEDRHVVSGPATIEHEGGPVPALPSAAGGTLPAAPVAGTLIDVTRPEPPPRHRLALLLGGVLVVAAGLATAWWLLTPVSVTVGAPTRGAAVQAVYATGSVEASVMIPLAGRTTARLAELYVDEGSTVKKGETLARFEDEDLQSTLRQLQAQADLAKQDYDRMAKLVESGTVTRAAYDQASSNWQAAKAAVDHATAEAGFLQLVSPADGQIVRRDGEVGQLIPANQTILWLLQDAPLRITSEVDEEDVSLVKVGQDVLVRADAFPGKVFNGRVQAMTPMGDAVARSYRVRIELSGPTPLLIGMTAETNIVVSEHKDALLVPATAVDGDKVWEVVDGRLVRQAVGVGIKGTDKVEIVSGLKDGDQIVLQPGAALRPGMRVRAVAKAGQ